MLHGTAQALLDVAMLDLEPFSRLICLSVCLPCLTRGTNKEVRRLEIVALKGKQSRKLYTVTSKLQA